MTEVSVASSPEPTKTYQDLCTKVRNTFTKALKRIEQERVATYWKTGELISNHISSSKDRNNYGERVVARLAEDLNIENSVLTRTIQFYRKFPHLGEGEIVARGQQLSWSQYRALLPVADDKTRMNLARRAQAESLTAPQVSEEVRKLAKVPESEKVSKRVKLIKPLYPGPLYHYRIVAEKKYGSAKSQLFVDLGFGTHIGVERFDLGLVRAGMVVKSIQDTDGTYKLKKTRKVKTDEVFTYSGSVLRVIDGDTLTMHLDLGFGIFKKVKIRLAGIDTPPLTEAKGRKAKTFLESIVRKNSQLIVRSEKSGKFSRYMGDIFLTPFNVKTSHLNQILVDRRLAKVTPKI